MRWTVRCLFLILAALSTVACDGDADVDAGISTDAGRGPDAGEVDGGPGRPDASPPDGGADSGAPDAGGADGGPLTDAGPPLSSCTFREDTDRIELSSAAEPGYLTPMLDPVFGTRVTRVSGDPGSPVGTLGATWGELARHGYSKRQPWNADQSLLYLSRGVNVFLDGRTFEPVMLASAPTSMNESRWHPTRPDVRVYVSDDTLGEWNVRTGATTTLATFSGYDELHMGPYEGNLSHDGSAVALYGTAPGGADVAFVYDIGTRTKGPDLDLTGVPVDWVSVSPLGTYLVVNGWNDETQVYTREGTPVGSRWTEYGRPSHYDLAVTLAGEEVAVGVSKSAPDDGRVIARRLSDGDVTVLTSGGYATHTSARNLGRPGWAYATYNYREEVWLPYRDEIVAVPLDGSLRVQRLAHLHASTYDYEGESHGVPSPDGRRVLFASDWDGSVRPVRSYVIDTGPVCAE